MSQWGHVTSATSELAELAARGQMMPFATDRYMETSVASDVRLLTPKRVGALRCGVGLSVAAFCDCSLAAGKSAVRVRKLRR